MVVRWLSLIGMVIWSGVSLDARADWPQWRGPQRDGAADDSPALLDALPAGGMQPVWMTDFDIPSGNQGGWSSPVIVGNRIYLYVHRKIRQADAELGPVEFPYLPPERRTGMTDEEYEEYEKNRRDEQERRSKSFRFDEVLYCLDRDSGAEIWSRERDSVYTRFPHSGTPWIGAGRLIVLAAARTLLCFDADDGDLIWDCKLPGEFRDEHYHSSVAVAGNTAAVYLDALYGVNVETGELQWEVAEEKSRRPGHSSPAVWNSTDGPKIIANTCTQNTICVDPATGEVLWRVNSEAGQSSPVVAGDRLLTYGQSRRGGLRCYQLGQGEPAELWRYQQLADPGSSPVVMGDEIYVQGDRRLACVDLADGTTRWSTRLDMTRPRYTSMVVAGDKAFYAMEGVLAWQAGSEEFEVVFNAKINKQGRMAEEEEFRRELKLDELGTSVAEQREADRIWRRQFDNAGPLPCSSPAILDGFLYVRLTNRLACYDLRASRSEGQ